MPSKMVTDRQKTAASLSGTLEAYSPQAAEDFLRLLEPDLEADVPPPDLLYFQRLLSRRLDRLRKNLIEVDEIHQAELQADRMLREQRDSAARELKTLVSRLRGVVDHAYGVGTSARFLGVEGRVPRDPVVLYRVADRLLEGLRQGFLDEAGHSLFAGVTLDVASFVGLLQGPMERLRDALDRLSQENPETIGRQLEKMSALEEYDRAYRATVNIAENLFRYVGQLDLAARIRPQQRSPTSGSAPREEAEEAEEAPTVDDTEATPDDFNRSIAAA